MFELIVSNLRQLGAASDLYSQIRFGLWLVFIVGWFVGVLGGIVLRLRRRGRMRLMPPWWSWLALCLVLMISPEAQAGSRTIWFLVCLVVVFCGWRVHFDPFGEYRHRKPAADPKAPRALTVSGLLRSDMSGCSSASLRAVLAVMCFAVALFLAFSDPEQGVAVGGVGFTLKVKALAAGGVLCAIWAIAGAYGCARARGAAQRAVESDQ